ncbi:histidine kinase N-terminal 7TM domain-containing protein [Haloarchaeobius sp. HRN-SO-5]|uniref:histidine kinase N-terminal 7TM domain-containing protein n=1 Tax=Haloarchaeobius sp. HRN-SO-5 TaxID=3446118 RepID=UPI003EBACEC7
MILSTVLHVILLVVSTVTTGALAGYAHQNRVEPGARSFSVLALSFTVYSGAHLLSLFAYPGLLGMGDALRMGLENVQWAGTVSIPVFWLAFALEYTGHEDLLTRRTLGAVSVVPAVTAVLVWTSRYQSLVWTENDVVTREGLVLLDQTFGPWLWGFMVYAYVLVAVGSFLLLRLVVLSDYLYTDQALLLVVGLAVPTVVNALTVLEVMPVAGVALDMTPYAFSVSGLAFGYAVFRRQLFDIVPATRRLGRQAAIADLNEGVVILDDASRVVYLNQRAASILDCDQRSSLATPVTDLAPDGALDLDRATLPAEVALGRSTYEVRSSTITDRNDAEIGYTLIFSDVTERKRRERRLRSQRVELERVNQLNDAIRGVNQVLVRATTRTQIETSVCDRLTTTTLYDGAWVIEDVDVGDAADVDVVSGTTRPAAPTPDGGANARDDSPAGAPTVDDGSPSTDPELLAALEALSDNSAVEADPTVVDGTVASTDGRSRSWALVPLANGPLIHGVLVLTTPREDAFGVQELSVLDELGDTIGHAISTVERRQLFVAETVTEVELLCAEPSDALVAIARQAEADLEVSGVVPADGSGVLLYLHVDGGDPDVVLEVAESMPGVEKGRVTEETVELVLVDRSVLFPLVDHGAVIQRATVSDGRLRVVAALGRDSDVRATVEAVHDVAPDTSLVAKREREGPLSVMVEDDDDDLDALTDRQQEAIEAAFRAGYFEWPRDSTAEEVAEAMGISAPTLLAHLRKAENRLFTAFFEDED